MTRSIGLRRRTLLASGLLALAVAAVIGLLLSTVLSLRNSQTLARHSDVVLAQAAANETLLVDMETGVRGFAITRRSEFLAPYMAATRAFPAAARQLESLVRDDSMQEARARSIDRAIADYATSYAAPLIAAARARPASARSVMATTEGKRRVDAVRAQFAAFQAAEARLADSRRRHADALATRAVIEAVLGLAGLIALVAVLTMYLRRALKREEEARVGLDVLARASETLSESLDYERTLERVAHIAVPLIADWCSVDLAEEGGGLHNVAVAHADPAKVAMARELQERYPPDPNERTGVPNVIRTGRAEIYPEIPDAMLVAAARDDEHLRLSRELGLVSAMAVPLIARGRTLGAITLVSAESGRRYGPDDLAYAEELARRAALAIENSRLYERERGIAETLQRSLLPDTLPVVPRAAVAARYLPAELAGEVGGDWYDVIPLPDGRVAIAIGDVVGHGVRAAAVMGQVRTALRAYALESESAGRTIERLKTMLRASGNRGMLGTLLLVVFDPANGRITYSSAGHPPALVRGPGGETRYLNEGRSTPLGVGFQAPREAEDELEPGSLMLLYTDGLVERRRERLTDGLVRLERAVASGPEDPEELLDSVLSELGADGPSADDIALIALAPARERAGRMRIRLPADRSSVTSARRTVARWLGGAGADDAELYELSVAVADACANAVEHAYGPADATFEVGADMVDGEVVLEVRDGGRWREPRGQNRGRGLQLMNAFTDSVEIDTGEQGTHVVMRRRLGGGNGI